MDENVRVEIIKNIETYVQKQIKSEKLSDLRIISSQNLLSLFKLFELYIDPTKNKKVFESLDDEFAKRINEKSFEIDEVVEIFRILFEHNS